MNRKRFGPVLILLACCLLLTGCPSFLSAESASAPIREPSSVPTEAEAAADNPEAFIRDRLASMGLEEKIGQLFLVAPGDLGLSPEKGLTEEALREALEHFPVGGLMLYDFNLVSPEQVRDLHSMIQNTASIPLFLSVDEEGGTVARVANHRGFQVPKYQSAGAVGASGDPDDALEMGRAIGAYLKDLGFNMDFAPVADVNTNPRNPVIGNRAFGREPELCSAMARAAADGLKSQGIIPTFKHFPGHGDTAEDSHLALAVSHKTRQEMERCEWLPFRSAGKDECIMVGHIACPELTGTMVPASLSPEIVTGILREELGFQGLIMTDALNMKAVTEQYGSGRACLMALEAGCHVLLMPENPREAFDTVREAVLSGSFPEERLDEAVTHVLSFKLSHGILKST